VRWTPAEHDRAWREEFEHFLHGIDLADVSWKREVRKGPPHTEILAAARARHADLIVMGSTGRTGLGRILMGSVTHRVLQQLPCTLLAVKGEDAADQLFEEDLRHMRLLVAEGCALMTKGSPGAALLKFRQILARDPFHLAALDGEADAHERLGQLEEAERCRRRAARLRQYEWV
jgi:hypothetical protein